MKHLIRFFLAGILVFFGTGVFAQNLMFEPIKGQLTEDQIDDIDDAERALGKIDSYIKKAKQIEKEYAKYKNSRKKRKKKKYERKTWEAKDYRIKAENQRQKIYEKACNAYSDFIRAANFYYPKDENSANSLNDGAMEKLDDADGKMSKYSKFDSKRDYKKKVEYSSMSSDISASQNLLTEALNDQFSALNLYLAQADKRAKEQADKEAWQQAKREDTTSAYQNYINNFPKGKYVADARKRIRELEELARLAHKTKENDKTNNINSGNFMFSVQIAASRLPLSKYILKRKYTDVSKIQREYSGNYYKYRVGVFNTYAEASQMRDNIRRTIPGAFIVVFEKSTNTQIEVENSMKPENMRD